MTGFLIFITLLFLAIIAYLLEKIQSDRSKFRSKIEILETFLVHISDEQLVQNNKLVLTEELKQKMKAINATLNKDIFDLNYQLFEELQVRK